MSAALDAGTMNMAGNDRLTLPRAVTPLLLTVAALITALFAGRAVQPALNRPLSSLRIDGALTHLSAAQISAAAAVSPQMHIFDVDLSALRKRVETLPWVGRARVSRVWPDTLDIRIWERAPAARWDSSELLDTEGTAFAPAAADLQPASIQALPNLSGPAGREAEVMDAYRGLSEALQSSEFAPAGLALDARGEWRLTTTHDVELRLGDGDPLAHIPLLLGTVSRTLAAYLEQVAYIDLRYSNGFSVGWINGGECSPLRAATSKGHVSTPAPSCGGTAAGTSTPTPSDTADAADTPAETSAPPAESAGAAAAAKKLGLAVAIPKTKLHAVAPASAKEIKK